MLREIHLFLSCSSVLFVFRGEKKDWHRGKRHKERGSELKGQRGWMVLCRDLQCRMLPWVETSEHHTGHLMSTPGILALAWLNFTLQLVIHSVSPRSPTCDLFRAIK